MDKIKNLLKEAKSFLTIDYKNLILLFKKDKFTKDFIKHNEKHFQEIRKKKENGSQILFELNPMQPHIIVYCYLAFILAKKHNAFLVAYHPIANKNHKEEVSFYIKKKLMIGLFSIYNSFGTQAFFVVNPSKAQKNKANKILTEIEKKILSKSDIENLKINNVWVGDQIYDTYLNRFKVPTIDIKSERWKKFLRESIELVLFWDDYLLKNNVKAIHASHCQYFLGIPLRIAISKGIPAYQASANHVYKLSKQNLFAYNTFTSFPKKFKKLPFKARKKALAIAKIKLSERFTGKTGIDIDNVKNSFGKIQATKFLSESNNYKVLVATHCFFDAPHCYGNNIFPDFYEWLSFLGKLSSQTNYEWYIKVHPDPLVQTHAIVKEFVDKFSRFQLLPDSVTHNQLIHEGINIVLTVYGSIGFEYAALGIPVINCSTNNPHIAYNFNINPKSIGEYRNILLKAQRIKLTINKNDVYEYYYMKYLSKEENIFYPDYCNKTLRDIGLSNQYTTRVWQHWLDSFTMKKHTTILKKLERVI